MSSCMNKTSIVDDDAIHVTSKTASQLKKEAKRLEKEAKFKAKLEKQAQSGDKNTKQKLKKVKTKPVVLYQGSTAPGQKKDVACPMPESYSPQYVEAAWFSWWEQSGFFKPEYGGRDINALNPKGKFMIVIPPPNVTGSLHVGHALTTAVQDAIVRWHRMRGETVLWNPGCDHAGIATQVVVEKKLWKEKQVTRHDLGRDKFNDEIWKWRNEKGDRIYHQLKKLGGSYDWDRACFTMDPKMCKAVTEAFVRLHDQGIIYRDTRLVNWSCALKSAISDIEVDKVEISGKTMMKVPGYEKKIEFGVLIHFAYIVQETGEEVIVATTRIETMLGDTAVAVHPEDSRYKHLHGKHVLHPFCDRILPILTDDFVDREFGTGAVKITPAHDSNDYEVGKRHSLPFVTILDDTGCIIGDCHEFVGMKRFDARYAVLSALKEKNLYKDTTDNPMVIPICSRSKDIIEPTLKPQWYLDCQEMCQQAVDVVKSGELKLIPANFDKIWYRWMENTQVWCISRQLWWGHQIPVYFITAIGDEKTCCEKEAESHYWVSGRNEEEAKQRAAERFNVDSCKIVLRRDEDVLDTWFSSALFPFSIFGWPDDTPELRAFYPGSLLETGHDILFFWVARMVMVGLKLLGKLPFKEVYLHAMVRDAHGRKMSKSLGNVVDPVDIISGVTLEDLHKQLEKSNLDAREIVKAKAGQKADYPHGIPECGTDALRFALCAYTSQARDINLDVLRVEGYRRFCNKLWNATRFALGILGNDFVPNSTMNNSSATATNVMNQWILSRAANAVRTSNESFAAYNFPGVTTACFNFWLYDLCDWYIESIKSIVYSAESTDMTNSMTEAAQNARQILYTCLDTGLRLIHPFMPFLTEELFQRLPRRQSPELCPPSICVESYPETIEYEKLFLPEVESIVSSMQSIVKTVRSIKADYNVVKQIANVYIITDDPSSLMQLSNIIASFINTSEVHIFGKSSDFVVPTGCAVASVSATCQVHLPLKGVVDVEKEKTKLEKKASILENQISKFHTDMSKPDYSSKVPSHVQASDAEKLANAQKEIDHVHTAIKNLSLIESDS